MVNASDMQPGSNPGTAHRPIQAVHPSGVDKLAAISRRWVTAVEYAVRRLRLDFKLCLSTALGFCAWRLFHIMVKLDEQPAMRQAVCPPYTHRSVYAKATLSAYICPSVCLLATYHLHLPGKLLKFYLLHIKYL